MATKKKNNVIFLKRPNGHDATFGPVDSFHIDSGELKGLTAEYAFVLGAEYMEFRSLLAGAGDDGFSMWVHLENKSRLEKLCWSRKRKYQSGNRNGRLVYFTVEPV